MEKGCLGVGEKQFVPVGIVYRVDDLNVQYIGFDFKGLNLSYIGNSCLVTTCEMGYSRVPAPPARMMPFTEVSFGFGNEMSIKSPSA